MAVICCSYFSINEQLHNFPFYVVGIVLARRLDLDALSPKTAFGGLIILLALAVASYFAITSFGTFDVEEGISYTAIGGLGGLMVILLAILVTRLRWLAKPLAVAGLYSSVIYLVHTIPLGGVRLLAFGVLDLSTDYFFAVLPFAFAAALIVPIVLQRYIIKPGSMWARLILGEVPKKPKVVNA
jgi:fucose 4-O-acetylase-like acetyltransferase